MEEKKERKIRKGRKFTDAVRKTSVQFLMLIIVQMGRYFRR